MSQTDDPPEERRHESIIERLRGTGVGMEDPNIVGDAGPTDVAPGQDPPPPPLDEELPPEEETPSERLLPSDADVELPAGPVEIVEVIGVVGPDGTVEIIEAAEVIEPPIE